MLIQRHFAIVRIPEAGELETVSRIAHIITYTREHETTVLV